MDPKITIVTKEGKTYLSMYVEKEMLEIPTEIYSTEKLGSPRITEALYENPDETPITFDKDYFNNRRGERPVPGPFEKLVPGENTFLVWEE